jgi:tripartite-type tricarboxylate transporter receptor subunit TctC
MILVVNPSTGVKIFEELIALAKEKPGQLSFASGGIGSPQHLAGEMLKILAGVDINHVPYKGGGPALVDVVAGQVSMMSAFTATALPFLNSSRIVGLVATTRESSSASAAHSVGLANRSARARDECVDGSVCASGYA